MNRAEAFRLKEKFGNDSFYLALEIMDKERIVLFWTQKENVAKYHKAQNEKKIQDLKEKLVKLQKEAKK